MKIDCKGTRAKQEVIAVMQTGEDGLDESDSIRSNNKLLGSR